MPRDEMSLWDYFRIIRERKKLIILVFAAAVLTSAIVSLFSKSVYEASTTMKIGRVEDQLVMNIPETRELLTSNELLEETIKTLGLNIPLYKLKNSIEIKDVSESGDLVRFVVRGESPEEVMEIAQALSSSILEKHQEILKHRVLMLHEEQDMEREKEERQYLEQQKFEKEENQREQELLRNLIETLELDIKLAEEKSRNLPGKTYLNSKLKIIDMKEKLFSLQKNYRSLMRPKEPQEGKEILTEPTIISEPPIKPEQPLKKPRIALNIFLAGITGLIAGVILALLGEYYIERG